MPHHLHSTCPIASVLDIIGDKWTLLVIRDLALGKQHFSELQQSPERIATNILSNRLTRLQESELIERFPSPVYSGKEAYRLTSKGKTLKPILKSLALWGLKNIEGTRLPDDVTL